MSDEWEDGHGFAGIVPTHGDYTLWVVDTVNLDALGLDLLLDNLATIRISGISDSSEDPA